MIINSILELKQKIFFLSNDNILYKLNKKKKDEKPPNNINMINLRDINYVLYKIPNTFDIIGYVNNIHIEDNHRGKTP